MRKFYLLAHLCGLMLLLTGVQTQAQTVFINELHYDNGGTDEGEGIEIAGPAGTDLSGWTIVLYNGGNNAPYNATLPLNGVLSNAGEGYGFYHIALPSNGLQNGSPDGLALINAEGSVVQFLSYEGVMTAASGPAAGMTSTDIGVFQPGNEAAGLTLQLSGTGTDYTDFTWQPSATATWGAPNNGQSFGGVVVAPTEADIATIRGMALGSLVNVTATLTAVGEFGSPAFIEDATGGIAVADAKISGSSTLAIGDEITLTAILASSNEMLQLISVSEFTSAGTAATPIAPALIGLDALAAHEGQLVRVEGVSFAESGFFKGNTNYTLSNGATTATLRLDSDVASLIGMVIPTEAATVTGIVNNFRGSMQLMPRFAEDVPAAKAPVPVEADIATIRTMAQGSLVRFTATLTAVDHFGGPAFLQDATGGIALFDAKIHANSALSIGDALTVTGTLGQFNEMLQITNVSAYTAHGPASTPLVPASISLAELAAYEGQLVKLDNIDFKAGGVFTGSSNYVLLQGNSTAELRIDNNVTSLEGLAIPKNLSTIYGIIASYRGVMQLQPRFAEDVPAAKAYEYPHSDVSFATTLDIASWNMEFFGATQANFGPNDEATQQANALTVLQNLQADIIAVQEISDEAVLQAVVAQLGDNWAISCSDKYSYSFNGPDPGFPAQKLCFIYNTEVVQLLEGPRVLFDAFYTELRTSTNTELLPAYPGEVSQFWSSGRLPYMISVRATVNGISEDLRLVNLHAKSGGNAADYARRKYDVQVLKDSLDARYGQDQLIILGDFNDDLDTSIAEGNDSPYNIFVNSQEYLSATKILSDGGYSSYLFNDDMIDHIILSDELAKAYLESSASLFFPFQLVTNYANSTSDHLPVMVRLQPQQKLVSIASARSQAAGTQVMLQATLTAVSEFGGPAYLQDATGGLAVTDAQLYTSETFAIGDLVSIQGTLSQADGQLQLSTIMGIENLGPAPTPLAPRVIALESLADYEAQLVQLEGVSFTEEGIFEAEGSYAFSDGSGTASLYVDAEVSSLHRLLLPEGSTTLVGIVGRRADTFVLMPRFAEDVADAAPISPLTATASGILKVYNGYQPQACTTLTATAEGGKGTYTYLWSTGETTASITVCPTDTQPYTVTITDAYGTTGSFELSVCVRQVDCSQNALKSKVIVSKEVGSTGFDLCLPADLVPYVLARGFMLGSITEEDCHSGSGSAGERISGYRYVDVEHLIVVEGSQVHYLPLEEGAVTISLYDLNGRLVQHVFSGTSQFAEQISARLHHQPAGMYLLQIATGSGFSKTIKIQR